ncbi:MAG TPA: 4-hydroxy-3-methylbut-2-enyl diphosphate reductase [Streptosporangiaceae bacterium]|nr:4-hydroxy-3-methylbut-2-enyl diphosphate reductase [Streptosporangiaceae bacterium]
MNRSLTRECFATTGVASGEVLVVTEFAHPERGPVRCAAAPAVAGSVRRAGARVRFGAAATADGPGTGGPAVLFFASYRDRTGPAVGFGAAAATADAAAMAAARAAVAEWAAVLRTRRLLLAATDPACAGARRARERAERLLGRTGAAGPRLYVYGRLTWNPAVAAELERRGAVFVAGLDRVPEGATLLLPAHGAPPDVRAEAAARHLRVIDATCPLAAAAHDATRAYAARGDTIAVIGDPGHASAAATRGQAPGRTLQVRGVADVAALDVPDPRRLSYVLQPGMPVEAVTPIVAALRARYPALRGQHPDQFCYAASDRLAAIRGASTLSDRTLVLGGADCADSQRLLEVAGGARLVTAAGDLRPEWLAGAATVTLTCGLGAAPGLPAEVIATLSGLGPLSVVERRVTSEVVAVPVVHSPGGGSGGEAARRHSVPAATLPR